MELKNVLKGVFDYFEKIFSKTSGTSNKELNDKLLGMAKSEEERAAMQEMFEDIDTYYLKRAEFLKSGMDAGEWLEEEIDSAAEDIEEAIKETYPEVTESQLEELNIADEMKQKMTETMDQEIASIVDEVNEEMTPVVEVLKETQTNNK